MNKSILMAALAALASSGCISVETRHTVDPIKLTVDVNVKVDEAVEQDISSEQKRPPKYFARIKELLANGTLGVDTKGALAIRSANVSQEIEDIVDEANADRTTRLRQIADETDSSLSEVRASHKEKMFEHLPSGTWVQDATGNWAQKQ